MKNISIICTALFGIFFLMYCTSSQQMKKKSPMEEYVSLLQGDWETGFGAVTFNDKGVATSLPQGGPSRLFLQSAFRDGNELMGIFEGEGGEKGPAVLFMAIEEDKFYMVSFLDEDGNPNKGLTDINRSREEREKYYDKCKQSSNLTLFFGLWGVRIYPFDPTTSYFCTHQWYAIRKYEDEEGGISHQRIAWDNEAKRFTRAPGVTTLSEIVTELPKFFSGSPALLLCDRMHHGDDHYQILRCDPNEGSLLSQIFMKDGLMTVYYHASMLGKEDLPLSNEDNYELFGFESLAKAQNHED